MLRAQTQPPGPTGAWRGLTDLTRESASFPLRGAQSNGILEDFLGVLSQKAFRFWRDQEVAWYLTSTRGGLPERFPVFVFFFRFIFVGMPSPLWDINTRNVLIQIVPCFFTVEAPASTCKWSKCYCRGLFKVCLHWLAAHQSVVLHENVVGSLAKIEIDRSYWIWVRPDFQATNSVKSALIPVGCQFMEEAPGEAPAPRPEVSGAKRDFLTGEYLCSSYVQLRCSALRLWLFVRPALCWFWLPKMQIRSLRIEFRSPLTFKSSHPQLQVLSLSQFDRFWAPKCFVGWGPARG